MSLRTLRRGTIALALVALLLLPLWMQNPYYTDIVSQILFWAIGALALNVLIGYAGLVSLGHAGLFGMAGYTVGLMLAAASTTAAGPISQNAYGARDVFALLSPFLLVVAVMFVPMLDLLLAIVRRTRAGRSAFSPDKMHLHHRLLQIGHSHRRVVLLIYLWVGIVAFGAASTIFFDPRDTGAVMLGAIAVAVLATLIPLLRRRDDLYDEE